MLTKERVKLITILFYNSVMKSNHDRVWETCRTIIYELMAEGEGVGRG